MSVHLGRRLILEEPVRLSDGAGGFTENWISLGVLWADMRAGTGRERFGSGVTKSSVPYRVIVRGAPEGTPSRPRPDQRFREGARFFRILAVAEYDRDARYLICFTTEEVAG